MYFAERHPFFRKVCEVVVIRRMASLKRTRPGSDEEEVEASKKARTAVQVEVAALVKAIKDELKDKPLNRTPKFEAAVSDFGRQVKGNNADGAIAARNTARKEAGLADEDEVCDPKQVTELINILNELNLEIGDDGEQDSSVMMGGGIGDFLIDLRRAVLKCLGRCGRKVSSAGNYVGDFVIGLFDKEEDARRKAARAAAPAIPDDILIAEGAVVAGELAVVGVTAALGGAFDPMYEPLKALLFPMVYGAFAGVPAFVVALGRRLIAMGVVGCAGGALSLMMLLKLAVIRGTAKGVVSAAGVGAAAIASAPDAILESFGVAAKASAYAVYKKLGGPQYKAALDDAKAKLLAALNLSDEAAAAEGAGPASVAGEGAAGAGAAAAAGPAAAVPDNGAIEALLQNAPGRALTLMGKIARAGKIAMSKVAGAAGDIAKGTQTLIGAAAAQLMLLSKRRSVSEIHEVAGQLDGVFGDLDGSSLEAIPEVREASAAAEAVEANAADGAAAAAAAAAAAPSAVIGAAGAAAAPMVEEEAGSGAAAAEMHKEEESNSDSDSESDEELPPVAVAPAGGHRCPKCGSEMVDRLLGVEKPKPKRKTRKADRKASPKKVKKSKKTKTAKKQGGSYRKNRKMSEKKRR